MGKGVPLPGMELVGSCPGAVPVGGEMLPVPPAPVTDVQLETGYGGVLQGLLEVLGLPDPVPGGEVPVPVGPWAVVEFDSGKGGEVSEGRLVEKPPPVLEALGVMPDPVGAIAALELEAGYGGRVPELG